MLIKKAELKEDLILKAEQQMFKENFEEMQISREEREIIRQKMLIEVKEKELYKQKEIFDVQKIKTEQKNAKLEQLYAKILNNISQKTIILQNDGWYPSFFEWKSGYFQMDTLRIYMPETSIPISQITKMKVLKEPGINYSKKLKITHFTKMYNFSIDGLDQMGYPIHYLWFAKVVCWKLQNRGCDLARAFVPQRKFFNVNVKNPYIDGVIYKKSQYLGTWELRYIAITAEGLFSFKDEKGGQTFSIKKDSTGELWTRFDIYEKMLTIKVHHSGRKTQFGIPITDYCMPSEINWLYPFYRLVYDK